MGFSDRFKKIFGQDKKENDQLLQETGIEPSDEGVSNDIETVSDEIELSPNGNVLFVCSGKIDGFPSFFSHTPCG